MKINIVKVASVVGTVLGLAGTLVSGWAGQRAMQNEVAKQVAEALVEQK